jgi:epoxyqueuosine reductase
MIANSTLKETIFSIAQLEGFINPRICANWRAPFSHDVFPEILDNDEDDLPPLLIAALPYGNNFAKDDGAESFGFGKIAPFARRNYYKEAVKRFKRVSLKIRNQFGGEKSDFRIFCNSRISEKPLAEISGVGCMGKNSLIITKDAGSLVILAAMTLPFKLESDKAELQRFDFCQSCDEKNPPCKNACPTSAVIGDGKINLEKCIQWYASGNLSENNLQGETRIPQEVLAHWGNRLYGCSDCQDACPHNRRVIQGTKTDEGFLPAQVDAQKIINMSDDEIKSFFKHTAMGLSWLGPKTIRRNAAIVLGTYKEQ